jgi:DNA-binding MarR family transcriptional regulator
VPYVFQTPTVAMLNDHGLFVGATRPPLPSGIGLVKVPAITPLTQVTFEVLIRLLRSPEHQLRLTDLGRQLAITTGGVTRLIDRLEAQGLVERVRAIDDRRAVYARLTDEGRDTVIRVLPDHIADLRKTFDALGPERHRLEHALRLLRDIVSVPS